MSEQTTAWAMILLLTAGALFPSLAAGAECRPKTMPANAEVTLTQSHPKAWVQLPAEIAANPTPLVQVPITRVVNTAQTPFSVFVYVEWRGRQPNSTSRKISLGNFTVFPADQPGTYDVRVSDGFRQLRALGVNPEREEVVLLLEMRRVSEKNAWTTIEVTIAPLRWEENPR